MGRHLFILPVPPTRCPTSHFPKNRMNNTLKLLLLQLQLLLLRTLILIQPLQRLRHRILHLLRIRPQLIPHPLLFIIQLIPHLIHQILQLIPRLHLLLQGLILLRHLLGLLEHPLYLLLRQPPLLCRDGDGLLVIRALVLRSDGQDAVDVHLEGDLNLRGPPRGRGDAGQVEGAQEVVVLRHGPLPLVDLDGDPVLVVLVGGEGLGLLGGDVGVPGDDRRHHPAHRLDTLREGDNVECDQNLRPLLPRDHPRLHSRPIGNSLIRINTPVGLLPVEVALKELLNLRNPRGPSHQDNLMDLMLLQLGIFENLVHWNQSLAEQIHVELFEPRSRGRL
uniref:Uncharacterized protein n=1 Tax=Arcella intermedia TaxID=1963864 RepID=A0A6B2L9H7_9EUKA